MEIEKQELIKILTMIKPGLSNKAIIEETTHFIFTGKQIVTYNDRICILYPFKTDFSCSIPADQFFKILNGVKVDKIKIDFEEDKIKIKSKGLNASLSTMSGENIIEMISVIDIDKMKADKKSLPEDFKEAITMCLFSVSKDLTNPAMTCLFINKNNIASTDDLRISEYAMKAKIKESILLPASSAVQLIKYSFDEYSVSEDNNWISFFNKEGLCFCCRLIEGEFPDYKGLIQDFESEEIELPKEIKSMIETAAISADGETDIEKEIEIKFEDGLILLKGQGKISKIETYSKAKIKDNITFKINPFFMSKIIDHTHSMFLGEGKALFKSGEFRHIIALRGE